MGLTLLLHMSFLPSFSILVNYERENQLLVNFKFARYSLIFRLCQYKFLIELYNVVNNFCKNINNHFSNFTEYCYYLHFSTGVLEQITELVLGRGDSSLSLVDIIRLLVYVYSTPSPDFQFRWILTLKFFKFFFSQRCLKTAHISLQNFEDWADVMKFNRIYII